MAIGGGLISLRCVLTMAAAQEDTDTPMMETGYQCAWCRKCAQKMLVCGRCKVTHESSV